MSVIFPPYPKTIDFKVWVTCLLCMKINILKFAIRTINYCYVTVQLCRDYLYVNSSTSATKTLYCNTYIIIIHTNQTCRTQLEKQGRAHKWCDSYGPPSYVREKAGWPARTYIHQLCVDTGYSPENRPEAMNDREEWRERVNDNPCWRHDMMIMIIHSRVYFKSGEGEIIVWTTLPVYMI